jgi:hypothetical protein
MLGLLDFTTGGCGMYRSLPDGGSELEAEFWDSPEIDFRDLRIDFRRLPFPLSPTSSIGEGLELGGVNRAVERRTGYGDS